MSMTKIVYLGIAAFVLIDSCALADDIPVVNDTMQSIILGSGYSTVEQRALDRCIKFTKPEQAVVGSHAGITEVYAEVATDREKLRSALGITVTGSMSAKYGKAEFGGDSKLSYLHEATFDKQTAYLVLRVDVKNQNSSLQVFQYTDAAKKAFGQRPSVFQ